jgi:uncharacterized protein (DUF1501 family)
MKDSRQHFELTRREFLSSAASAAALPFLLSLGGEAAAQAVAAPPAPRPAKAKSMIQIWMWGGPSHLDTFDPKPEAGRDYCGPLDKPIPTNVDGIRICQLLPMLAQQADKYSIIRSMTHGINAHETAAYRMQTGRTAGGGTVYPSVGAVVSLFKGYDQGYKSLIPPYVVLTTPQGRFSESGFLGPKYKPFFTGGDPSKTPFLVEGLVVEGLTRERRDQRRTLLQSLDTLGKADAKNELFQQINQADDQAYARIEGDAAKVFDLSTESEAMREGYGKNWFGQSCLVARRLVEQGVPYITINYRGWDTHKRHFETIQRMEPEMDRGMATLLADLSERGLLDSTIVWWGGEFGRTPRIGWEAPWYGGRGHYGPCFSVVVAGGGFKGGHVVGASDATGEQVAERPVAPQDLLGSFYELLGIDPDGRMPNNQNLDVPVMASPSAAGRLKEIMG